jgi:hypothetical protein
MKKALYLILILATFKSDLKAQSNTNCWYSYDYYYCNSKPGIKKIKGHKASVCFNDKAISLYTKETGMITFLYRETEGYMDSSVMMPCWEGVSDGDVWASRQYHIKMSMNHLIKIEQTKGADWCVWLWEPCHNVQGCINIGKKTRKEWSPSL